MNIKKGLASITWSDVVVRAILSAGLAAGYVALADVQPTQAAVTLGTAFVLALAFLAIHRSHRA